MADKKLSRKQRQERMEKIRDWICEQIEQEMPGLSSMADVTASQLFNQLKRAVSRVKELKKDEWSFLPNTQWESLVDTQGSMIEERLIQTFGPPPKQEEHPKKKGQGNFLDVMAGEKSIFECLQTKEGRNDLIMAEAMKWGFIIPLNLTIVLFTNNPNSPNSIIPDREAFVQNLVGQIAKLEFISRQFFYDYIAAWVKTNVPDSSENRDFYRDFPKWLEALKKEVDQKLQETAV